MANKLNSKEKKAVDLTQKIWDKLGLGKFKEASFQASKKTGVPADIIHNYFASLLPESMEQWTQLNKMHETNFKKSVNDNNINEAISNLTDYAKFNKNIKECLNDKMSDAIQESMEDTGNFLESEDGIMFLTLEELAEAKDCGDEDCDCDDCVDVEIDESITNEMLDERKIIYRVTSKGGKGIHRVKKIRCSPGKKVVTVNGVKKCVAFTGAERAKKKIAIKRAVRTKRAKGVGASRLATRKRLKSVRRRKAMGL